MQLTKMTVTMSAASTITYRQVRLHTLTLTDKKYSAHIQEDESVDGEPDIITCSAYN